jgi:hypothetical protein
MYKPIPTVTPTSIPGQEWLGNRGKAGDDDGEMGLAGLGGEQEWRWRSSKIAHEEYQRRLRYTQYSLRFPPYSIQKHLLNQLTTI